MDTEELLSFLRVHQPMPGDLDISDVEGDTFAAAFEKKEEKEGDWQSFERKFNGLEFLTPVIGGRFLLHRH
jgi:hypothetical protein